MSTPRYKSLYTDLLNDYRESTAINITLFKENRQQQATIVRLLGENQQLQEANKKMETAIDKQLAANLKKAEAAIKTFPIPEKDQAEYTAAKQKFDETKKATKEHKG